MADVPFGNVAESIILDGQQNNYDKFNYIHSTNNNMLTNIDPGINNMNPNGLKINAKIMIHLLSLMKQLIMNNISILHTTIM